MGMYTEFHCRFELKQDTPEAVKNILLYLMGKEVTELKFPDHPFFDMDFHFILSIASSSHITSDSYLKVEYSIPVVYISTSFKNYHDEIRQFLDWIKPYIHSWGEPQFLGYYLWEVDAHPTFIYLNTEGNLVYLRHNYEDVR